MHVAHPFLRLLFIGALCAAAITASAQAPTVTLTKSNYHGYGISCFGLKNGSIDATVTGGTAPYTYLWSNGATTQDISALASGYYKITVTDAALNVVTADITLTEPLTVKTVATAYKYPNGFNVSCYECYNGSIGVTVSGGVSPYAYLWTDAATIKDRTGLGAGNFTLKVTDYNGCVHWSDLVPLAQPDRKDWTMNGNAGTTPGTQFLGTTDAQDVVFKSNGTERLRLKSNGDIMLGSLAGVGLLYRDPDGILRGGGFPTLGPAHPPTYCYMLEDYPFWETRGNNFSQLCPDEIPLLGTLGAMPLNVVTNGIERLRITEGGLVGIGPELPLADQLEVHTTLERSGLTLANDRTDDNAHTEIRFKKNGDGRWALGCDMEANGGQDFFLWDEVAGATRIAVNSEGKVGIGTTPPVNGTLYRLYVDQGIATRDVKVQANGWPDFVFAKNYELLSLSELREHLSAHQHLPGIPSATELESNGGYEVGDMQARILKVVEEQALYILQLEERINALEQRGQGNQH
ncbi:MAG: SprB repeat-containing protein [Flavobacteriales bacterium]|nr:SprB repeat-containing protein [Flavobacteriales bacterium]